jgi:putative heme-binding domain-containing protein
LFLPRLLILLAVATVLGSAQPRPYDIFRTPSPIQIDGKLDEPAWQQAPSVGDFQFPWFESGTREQTVAKLLWDDNYLYVSWQAHDKHISAYVTQRHGPVSKDDCVELFLSPNPAKVRNYYTFEINAIGAMLNRNRADWWTGPPTWEPEGMLYRATFHGLPQKDESPTDDGWIVEAAIPLQNFARDAAHTPPLDGDQWRLNLQRLGGRTNAQLSSWASFPPGVRSFHTPEVFRPVLFRNQPPAATAAASPDTILAGREIYNRSCTMCHGKDGDAGDRGPALAARRRYLRSTEQQLFDAIKQGIPGTLMPSSPLPEADIAKMVAFIRSLRATAIETPVTGNPAAGQTVFLGKGGCSTCHMVNGRGGLVGPDLSNIGAERSLRYLSEALTTPRPHIPAGYQPVELVTTAGERLRGTLKNEHNFSLQILDQSGRLHLLTRDEVRSITYGTRSPMPTGFNQTLTPSEFDNVVAYLSRLARQPDAPRANRRRP